MSIDLTVHPARRRRAFELTGVSPSGHGSYDCVVYNACATLTSSAATLTVFASGAGDGNLDGRADGADIGGFIAAVMLGGSPSAGYCAFDMNSDGVVDSGDVEGFVANLLAG